MSATRPVTAEELLAMGEGRRELALGQVVFPGDTFAEVEARARMWLEHGSRAVWIVEPDSRRVMVHEPGRDRRDLTSADTLEGGEVLPGFAVPVARLFED